MSCHNVLERGAWAGPSGYTKVSRLPLHDYLGPNTKKQWLQQQHRKKLLRPSIFPPIIKNRSCILYITRKISLCKLRLSCGSDKTAKLKSRCVSPRILNLLTLTPTRSMLASSCMPIPFLMIRRLPSLKPPEQVINWPWPCLSLKKKEF